MIDIAPLNHELWRQFDARMDAFHLHGYDKISANAVAADFADRVGHFDVVHCSGVLYHLPNPFELLVAMRTITSEFLILTSMTIPLVIENSAGKMEVTGGRAIFVPALSETSRAIVREHFTSLGMRGDAIQGLSQCDWLTPAGRPNFGPWWWLMPADVIKAMLDSLQFEILREGESWRGLAASFFCRKRSVVSVPK